MEAQTLNSGRGKPKKKVKAARRVSWGVVEAVQKTTPTSRTLFAAMSGTTWERPVVWRAQSWSSLHNMAYGKQLNGAENERQAAASR